MGSPERVAMVAMHGSPAVSLGSGEAGGMDVAIVSLATELSKRGVEVDLLTRATGEPRTVGIADGVVVHELAAGPRGRLSRERLAEASDEFGESVAALARSGRGYDIIHSHHWRSGIATLPVALELGLPFVQSFHTLAAMRNRALARGEAAEPDTRVRSEAYLAQQADAVIASSTVEVSALIDGVGAPAGRVWVVPPGVDSELFSPSRAISEAMVRGQLGIESDRPIVVVAGRVQPLKGQELAVQAIAAMAGLRPVLVIAGEPGAGAERYAESLHAAAGNDIVFTGALDREDLADLLAAAALTLVPSFSETFGLVALESAASGTPVIATIAAGGTGSVAPGESGVLIGSRDPDEWARTITALLEDRLLLEELSASARTHALNFTWGASAAGLLGIYASLL
jgi:D-inositol-3-phosphate glycosyltransferase